MDTELVRRGLVPSREVARELVSSGRVTVSGAPATKPGRLVDTAEPIEVVGDPRPYVSRGGVKLAGALDAFGMDPTGYRCLDLGASTGGFTDCLLGRGAREVVAVDVGRGQLDWSLRKDPRVEVRERTDVRDLDPGGLGSFDLVVCDLAFISLRTVLGPIAVVAGEAQVLALVKPQFEVGRGRVGKGGVVRDPALREEALRSVVRAAREAGLEAVGSCPAPIPGADGNVETFLLLRRAARG